jgi:hypothetical protein
MEMHAHEPGRYRLVVSAGWMVPTHVLEEAVAATTSDGTTVAVVIPAVLPSALPMWAAPGRILERVSRQRQAARARMDALGLKGSVDVVPCRSVHAAISALCAEHPHEIVVAGSASWSCGALSALSVWIHQPVPGSAP